jgi:hypothetical protein
MPTPKLSMFMFKSRMTESDLASFDSAADQLFSSEERKRIRFKLVNGEIEVDGPDELARRLATALGAKA